MTKTTKIIKPQWKDVTADYPEIRQAFFVAEQITSKGQEIFRQMITDMWNMEAKSDEELFQNRLQVVNLIGWAETQTCLQATNTPIPDDFETYYKFMK